MSRNQHIFALSILFLLLIFTRFYKLNTTPPVISHDESYYLVEAQTVALSGASPDGQTQPHQLKPSHPLFAELPATLMTPVTKLNLTDSLLTARLTHALAGVAVVALLGYLAFLLTKNPIIGYLASAAAIINPWLFQFSRMSFDALFSLTFYLAGMIVLIRLKNWAKLLCLPLFLLGFYQYQGLKTIFLPLILFTILYVYFQQVRPLKANIKHHTYPLIALALIVLAFFFSHVVRVQQSGLRTQDIFTPSHELITNQTTLFRQYSPLTSFNRIVINRYTIYAREVATKYIEVFNTRTLFLEGEPLRNPFSFWTWGMFLPLSLIFIIAGCIYLLKDKLLRASGLLLLAMLLFAPLPEVINATSSWIMFRASLLIPAGVILAAVGVYFLYQKLPKIIFALLVGIHLASALVFTYEYFHLYPVLSTRDKYFGERVMAEYIRRTPAEHSFLVLAPEPIFAFNSVLIFNPLITQANLGQINQAYAQENFSIQNIKVDSKCLNRDDLNHNSTLIYDPLFQPCPGSEAIGLEHNNSRISALLDAGTHFEILNDTLCQSYSSQPYAIANQVDFDLVQLTDQEFCHMFIHTLE